MSLNMSLKNKIFSIFVSVIVMAISLVGWYGYTTSSEAYINSAFDVSNQKTNAINMEIEGALNAVPKDILYLTEVHSLKQFIIWEKMNEKRKTKEWKELFSNALIDFLEKKENFFKARIIDIDGNEIISARYDKKTNKARILSDEFLQNKKGRDYVEITKKLEKNKFYVSHMNLNIENSQIEKPYVPVIRYSTPIINSNHEVTGIFVGNIYADTVLDILRKSTVEDNENKIEYFLVDANGDYLYNKNSKKLWNTQLSHGITFNKEHFNINDKLRDKDKENGAFIENDKIYSYSRVHSLHQDKNNNYWYVISIVDTSVALSKLDNFTTVFTAIIIFVLIFSFFIIRFFIDQLTYPLAQVTKQLNALSRGEIKRENIEYEDDDEIGQIVNSTRIVVDAIETTIKQANSVANGDFTKEIQLLSKDDKLGLAIQDMTKRLKEIAALARNLSVGAYDVHILAKGSDDALGIALVDMVEYLKGITNIAESISNGNLNVRHKAKSSDDRLGHAILQMIKYLRTILKQANAISRDDLSSRIDAKSDSDELGLALGVMTDILRANSVKNSNEIYLNDGIRDFSDKLVGINDTTLLASKAIALCSRYVNGSGGVVYTFDKEKSELNLIASFALSDSKKMFSRFKLGEGVIGQVALEKKAILLHNIQESEYQVKSGTTLSKPKYIYLFPLIHEDELLGVVEVMSFNEFTHSNKAYLDEVASIFAIELYTSIQNLHIKELLEKSQQALEELQIQSEELQESNVQMEEQQQQLTVQSGELKDKNNHLALAKKEIDKRADELEKASKYKSEFLANMSHELRTPLNSIILLSKLLSMNSSDKLDEDSVKKASVINKAGNDLLLLINDILDLSKVESGKMEVDFYPASSNEILEDIKDLFEPIADEKGIKFIINDNFTDSFVTDKTKLSQVLKNLLSNAFKFTKNGSVTLDVNSTDTDIIISVKDTGIGIQSSKLDKIFSAFKQVDGSISREFGGTGLGLSISKTMTELIQGSIKVQSKEGEGTTFIITLPLNCVLKESETMSDDKYKDILVDTISMGSEIEEVSFTQNELSNKNILIVDDDSRNIFTLTSILENMNAEVNSVFNGKEAIEVLERERIDLVLMDVMMPVMDGLSAIKSIRLQEKFKKLPIIAITAKTMPEDKQSCLDAGANDYLSKPIDHDSLISMIKAWIK